MHDLTKTAPHHVVTQGQSCSINVRGKGVVREGVMLCDLLSVTLRTLCAIKNTYCALTFEFSQLQPGKKWSMG
jgi:hypothetical protein